MNEHDYSTELAPIPRRRDQLLPALHAVHAAAGWLPEAAIAAAARHVFVPLSEVYGIVTSYSELRLTPPDPELVEVCTGLSCRMAGADGIIAALEAEGRPVERVPCRFLCGVAPVMEYQGRYHGRAAGMPAPVRRAPFPARGAPAPGGSGPLPERRDAAVERVQHLSARTRIAVADGVCTRAAGADDALDAALAGASQAADGSPWLVRTGCDGACHAQPVVTVRRPDGSVERFERAGRADAAGLMRAMAAGSGMQAAAGAPYPGQTRRVLRNCGVVDPESLDEALAAGAYLGLERALTMKPEDVIELVRAAGLRGRGGAYFPTHVKWEGARRLPGPRYLVVNAEEGEPGVFKDRHLMEGDPHALVEGTLIAAYAVGAERAFIYINGQAELSAARVAKAVEDARAAGLVGDGILGAGFTCEIDLYRGAGGYVCGEESVILNSIEGERAVPRFRPPLPTEAGLWGRPTVINNVETLMNLPLILTEGVDWFRQVGTADYPGTKLMCLSGAVQRPGLVEVAMGMTIRQIVEEAGGGSLPGHTITAAVVGGPSGGLMPAAMLDVPIAGGMLHPSGPVLGAGGIVVLDERTPLRFALRELTAYNKDESCGKCTPCREGTARALAILDRAAAEPLSAEDRQELLELCDVMQTASLCGLGQMAPGPIRSALTLFT
jgi:NADH:ubiquinone oxidoreductase subunit F (NADH-binding)/NADH:ubiquinone oxidoreductase subunit E